MLEPGTLVGGRYRVGTLLGRGGMGEVVEAVHEQLGTRVAIKVLREERAQKPELIERFLREARAAAQLRGEHVCRVHDFGTLERGAPYMVMELLAGRDLASIVKNTGPLAPGVVARYMVEACAAMAEAHALGIVHRDLKPSNLFLCDRPDGTASIKVLDFGIAKAIGHDSALTDTDHSIGSPAYMSPEQIKSSKFVDTRTDIWGLGIVMFELLTGQMPFEADNPAGLALAITTQKVPPLPASVPKRFGEIVRRCLQRDPERRFQDVAELAAALEPLVTKEEKGATAIARMLATGPVAIVDGASTAPAIPSKVAALPKHTTSREMAGESQPVIPALRNSWPLVLAIGGALAIGSVVTYVAVGRRSETPMPPTPAPAAPAAAPQPPPPAPPDAAAPAVPATVDATLAPPDAAVATPPIDAPAPTPARRPIRKPTPTPQDFSRSRY